MKQIARVASCILSIACVASAGIPAATAKADGEQQQRVKPLTSNVQNFVLESLSQTFLKTSANTSATLPRNKDNLDEVADRYAHVGESEAEMYYQENDNITIASSEYVSTAVDVDYTPTQSQTEEEENLEDIQDPNRIYSNVLKPGDESAEVRVLQKRLMQLEYMEHDNATGYYGNATQEGVERFQRSMKIEIDGIAGRSTIDMLFSGNAKTYTIYPGDKGLDIVTMQQRLMELEYYWGAHNGVYDSATQTAMELFQNKNGLYDDGIVGVDTRDKLYSPDAVIGHVPKPTPKPTPTPKPVVVNPPSSGGGGSSNFGAGNGGGGSKPASKPAKTNPPVANPDTGEVAEGDGGEAAPPIEDGAVDVPVADVPAAQPEQAPEAPQPDPEPVPEAPQAQPEQQPDPEPVATQAPVATAEPTKAPVIEEGGSVADNTQPDPTNKPAETNKPETTQSPDSPQKPTATITPKPAESTQQPEKTQAPAEESSSGSGTVSKFIEVANAQSGKRYKLGGNGPNSFDCSGFVYYSLNNSGKKVPRLSAAGYYSNGWPKVSKSSLQVGDLLFFYKPGGKSIGHVGIYVGGNRMIHASTSEGKILTTNLSQAYWVNNYAGARRVF